MPMPDISVIDESVIDETRIDDTVALSAVFISPDDEPMQLDYSHIITEDGAPVDNLLSERQQRLLVDSLYASWRPPGDARAFVAMANVGLFYALHAPAYVPDALVSLDVRLPDDPFPKQNRSYFIWEYGKAPEIVVEIVSNRKGGELSDKVANYARLGIPYYIVFDPYRYLGTEMLHVFTLRDLGYVKIAPGSLPPLGLGVTLWNGETEGMQGVWLRWLDAEGNLLLSGYERAEQERRRAEVERQQADEARQQAGEARQEAEIIYQRAEMLAAKLRELGVDPDAL